MPNFNVEIAQFLERYGLETKAPTTYTGSEPRIIKSGARNQTLTAIAGVFEKIGLAPNLLEAAIRGIATNPNAVESTDWDEGEIERIVGNISGRSSSTFDAGAIISETVDDSTPVPELKWLVEGFMPDEGLTLAFGLPAHGKSYVALDICRICSTGGTWINGGTVQRKLSRIGYFDWERRGAMFKRRRTALMRGQGVTIDYNVVTRPLSQAIDDIVQITLARGYELIVLDSLSIAIMTGDLMQAHEVIPRMFALHELGVPVLILDHMAKPQAGANPAYASAYGSMFKEAIVSMAWHVVKANPTNFTEGYMDFRLMPKKNNFDVGLQPIDAHLALDVDDTGRLLSVSVNPGFVGGDNPPDVQIVDALTHRTEATIRELAQQTGLSESTIRRHLEGSGGLIEQGAVYVSHQGGDGRGNATRYAFVKWPDTETPT